MADKGSDQGAAARDKRTTPQAEPSPAPRRGVAPIGSFVPRIASAAFEAHGFPTAAILTDWPAIAGADMAGYTAPERLIWPTRARTQSADHEAQTVARGRHGQRTGATLVLRVDGPQAIEVQHAAAQIIERVNAYFGYGAVAQLRIIQGPVRRTSPRGAEPERDREPLSDPQLDAIEDEGLRSALARLGQRLRDPEPGPE